MTKKLQTEVNHLTTVLQCPDMMVFLLLWNWHPTVLLEKVFKWRSRSFTSSPHLPGNPLKFIWKGSPRSSFSIYSGIGEVGWSTYQLFCIAADQGDIQANILSGLNVAWNSANARWAPPCLLLCRQSDLTQYSSIACNKAGKGRGGSTKAKWKQD